MIKCWNASAGLQGDLPKTSASSTRSPGEAQWAGRSFLMGSRVLWLLFCVRMYAIELRDVPADLARKLPKYELVPATLLGRLAVNINFRGRGLGRRLLMDALYRSLQSSRQVASTTVIVDAKDDAARAFYRKYGFMELPNVERRLLLPMATIEALFAE